MIHLGKNTTSRIISKGIAAGVSQNTYRGLVTAHRKATGARNFTACDSLLIGDKCGAHTVPYIEAKNSSALFEHEATTSKISEDVLFYCVQRGLMTLDAVIASAAKQSIGLKQDWIASSQVLLAMTSFEIRTN